MKKKVKVLFVCLANICRSPAAEGVLRKLAKHEELLEIQAISCGLGDWHTGRLPDERMREAAKLRGIILTSRAQPFRIEFLDEFDYVLAADNEILHLLYQNAKDPGHKAKIHLITAFSPSYKGQDVPDPFYSGIGAFDQVLDILEDSCEGLLQNIKQKLSESQQ